MMRVWFTRERVVDDARPGLALEGETGGVSCVRSHGVVSTSDDSDETRAVSLTPVRAVDRVELTNTEHRALSGL